MITVPDRYGGQTDDGRHAISQLRSALATVMKWKTLHSTVHLLILVDPQYETFTTISNILLYFITLLYNYSLFHELVSPISNNSVWRTLSLLFIVAYSVWSVITAHNATPLNRDHWGTDDWLPADHTSPKPTAEYCQSSVTPDGSECMSQLHHSRRNHINKWKPVNFLLNTNKV